ncbi:MAG TPA: (Fe-S)-binding protein [candidate division Zixibacteria bacterium]|nr:(Fe-S)-binding protein [candidate division Zixibacteria bacterium]
MLSAIEKIAFLLLAAGSAYLGGRGFYDVYRAIARGRPDDRFTHLSERIRRALVIVLTQQTVLKTRPVVSVLHAMVFYGFVFYFLVNLVDVLEGFSSFHARGGPWNLFNVLADVLTAAVLLGMAGLVARRWWVRPADFDFPANVPVQESVRPGIRRDSTIVAAFILFHVGCRLFFKATQAALEGSDPFLPVSSLAASLFAGAPAGLVQGLNHFFWWGALGSILVFIPYFPRSKHIHIFMAPINLALRKENPGTLQPMDFEKEEVFGASRLEELAWPRLLDAYSCIMCNRCQEVCPATTTGKALSPAALLINERFEINRILPEFASGKESPRPLLEFALNEEAAWACTTCNACIDICPVGNEQMLHIIDIRRERVLGAAEFPAGLKNAFNHMERAGNPWGMAAEERMAWTKGLPFAVPTVAENPDPDVLYWVGCAVAFDPRAQKIARSMARLLDAAGINWAVFGKEEKCTGDAARRSGNEYLFAEMAAAAVAALDEVKFKTIVTTCPHCFHTIANEYPQFGGRYTVRHHTDFIAELLREGKLPLDGADARNVTYHDPCYLGRHNGIFDPPRAAIESAGARLVDPPRARRSSFCCGAGGGQFWKEEEKGRERVSTNRYRELKATGAAAIATGCPFCMRMLVEEAAKEETGAPEILDIAEIVAGRLRPGGV